MKHSQYHEWRTDDGRPLLRRDENGMYCVLIEACTSMDLIELGEALADAIGIVEINEEIVEALDRVYPEPVNGKRYPATTGA